MLFNSLSFQFGFLPIALAGFFVLGRWNPRWAGIWLASASLFFYGCWKTSFLGLLLASVVFNYLAGSLIGREARKSVGNRGRPILAAAIGANLLLLGYWKYAGFFAGIANALVGSSFDFGRIILPLGISFFTFTQIAFLVDAFQGKTADYDFAHYLLFVTYFPHLIAGPILHHGQIIPQFVEKRTYRIDWANVSAGLTFFVIGLAKKVVMADRLAGIATPIFSSVRHGAKPFGIEAWAGALAYTLQLYFDFSGYSDMAIGLSLFFNVKLPLNFNSPYKATSIVDFWRRWHMTLAAFLRDYLYIPLGGNRKGKARRYLNLFATMVIGGLWHGAAWTFVAWGALHGVYLMLNHGFRRLKAALGFNSKEEAGPAGAALAGAITFLAVVIAWVLFRADNFTTASGMLLGMTRVFGPQETETAFAAIGLDDGYALWLIGAGLAAVWLLPNTQELMPMALAPRGRTPAPRQSWTSRLAWNPARWWTWSAIGILFGVSILLMSPARVSEFLYFQF